VPGDIPSSDPDFLLQNPAEAAGGEQDGFEESAANGRQLRRRDTEPE
jgi:hypothetical protein